MRATALVLAATLASAGCVGTKGKVVGVAFTAVGAGMIGLAATDDSNDFKTPGYVIGTSLVVTSLLGLWLGYEFEQWAADSHIAE